jgi:Thioesterase-like superfamily
VTDSQRSFCEQTKIQAVSSHFEGYVYPDWNEWLPNGGYVSSIALRAAIGVSRNYQLRTVSVEFLRPATVGDLKLQTSILYSSVNAECVRVDAIQNGLARLTLTAWFAPATTDGPTRTPQMRKPSQPIADLVSTRERNRGHSGYPYANCVDQYDVSVLENWEQRSGLPAFIEQYIEWRKPTCMSTCSCRYGRVLVVADLLPYFALMRAIPAFEREFVCPTLTLSARFPAARSIPLALHGRADVGWCDGRLFDSDVEVRDSIGDLIALASQSSLLHRLKRPQTPRRRDTR